MSAFCLPAILYAEYDKENIFDVHIHYSHDLWDGLSPDQAIAWLRKVGVSRALVSSSSDEGTQKLYQAAPQMVIPALRPYRKLGTINIWTKDETVIPYLEERLAKYRYAAIGEFHVTGADADTPVVRRVVQLAQKYQLLLHVHGDADAIQRIFKQDPQARILWAHAGFEHAALVEETMDQHKNLWADLSFRREIYSNQQFLRTWRELLIKHADRFMLGMDTYTPQRWLKLDQVMAWQHQLLHALPDYVAEKIAYENALNVIASNFKPSI
jgi:hypothetical protein